ELSLPSLHDALPICDRRIAVVDEQDLEWRPVALEQRTTEMVHVHDTRSRLLGADPGLRDAPRRRVAHRVTAPADTELAGHRGQRQDGERRIASVAIAFLTPAASDQRGG